MLKALNHKIQLLVHEEVIEGLGNIFFCTCFEDYTMTYDLRVSLHFGDKSCITIHSALAHDIRKRQVWKRDVLLFSKIDPATELGTNFSIQTLSLRLHDGQVETNWGCRHDWEDLDNELVTYCDLFMSRPDNKLFLSVSRTWSLHRAMKLHVNSKDLGDIVIENISRRKSALLKLSKYYGSVTTKCKAREHRIGARLDESYRNAVWVSTQLTSQIRQCLKVCISVFIFCEQIGPALLNQLYLQNHHVL